ncbi:APC family permease [Aquirufa regiilacus]|uniref:Amino acid permease n=1 Tax=Aquirufa regiilacus TaxID=3024868 RepID=A0ABU3TQX6_9BACT|nr:MULTISPECIES: amino acid permease [unclassified Aquirufa]MDT8886777.1 amino acid permease [Aquirufa sp. LEPPI-3A]MDU0808258.1 amino acid permease [Aquirufa sp. LEOWEIH-7C]
MSKKLNTTDATLLVMGSMIGSGIFLVSSEVGRSLTSPIWWIGTWILTSFLTVTGAYAYGKLSSKFPATGGQYIYLKEAYNPLTGFLFGWTTFLVIQTGTIAAVAVAFARYTGFIWPDYINDVPMIGNYITSQQILAAILIVILTGANLKGISFAAIIQNVFTVTKIGAIVLIIIIGLFVGIQNEWIHFNNFFVEGNTLNPLTNKLEYVSTTTLLSIFGAAMIGPLFSSSAWNNVTFASQDFEHPQKTIAKGLVYGSALVCALYLLTNIAYLAILPLQGDPNGTTSYLRGIMFASQDRLGSAALQTVLGNIGALVMAILIMISTFGCNNGIILAGGRLFEAMAHDKLFFKKAAEVNQNNAPAYSLIIQGIWSILLCFSGSYNSLLDFTVFAILLFYFLTVLAVFNQRIMQEKLAFKDQLLFATYIILLLLISINLLYTKTVPSSIGLGIVLAGIPFYYVMKKREIN